MKNNRRTRQRFATVVAAVGMLVMSSGVALIAAAGPANAGGGGSWDHKVNVCHATDSDTNPYDGISVDTNAVESSGHLAHRNSPNKVWNTDGTWHGVHHNAGDPKRDYIESYEGHALDGSFDKSWCDASGTIDPASADVQWTEPSCQNGNTAGYETSGDHVTWSVKEGSAAPGSYIKLKASAESPYKLPGNKTYQYFEHTFGSAVDCRQVVDTPTVTFTDPTCENQNTASYETDGEHVTFEVLSGEAAPGSTIVIKATADDGYKFEVDGRETTTTTFEHTYPAAEVCTSRTATADVTFIDPTCQNENTASYEESGEHVTFEVSGTAAPGEHVVITATPDEGYAFGDVDSDTKVFEYTYPAAEVCTVVSPPVVPDAPAFVDPTCANDNTPAVQLPVSDAVTYETSGDVVAGGSVTVTATATEGNTIAEGADTMWTHTFADAETGCVVVQPPVVSPPTVVPQGTTVVTPTLVDSGLAGVTAADLRGQQGRALVVAGLIMLMVAGGLGFRTRGSRSEI